MAYGKVKVTKSDVRRELIRYWQQYAREAEETYDRRFWNEQFRHPVEGVDDFIRYMTWERDITSKGRK